jgi:hypothetical protein
MRAAQLADRQNKSDILKQVVWDRPSFWWISLESIWKPHYLSLFHVGSCWFVGSTFAFLQLGIKISKFQRTALPAIAIVIDAPDHTNT